MTTTIHGIEFHVDIRDRQAVLDFLWDGFVRKGWPPSIQDDTCLYRHPDGQTCAHGRLYVDPSILHEYENSSALIVLSRLLPKNTLDYDTLAFHRGVQLAHDYAARSVLMIEVGVGPVPLPTTDLPFRDLIQANLKHLADQANLLDPSRDLP